MTTHDIRPAIGQGVLHLFFKASPAVDAASAVAAVKAARGREDQVVSVAMLGHKADIAVMGIGPNLWSLRELQTDLVASRPRTGRQLRLAHRAERVFQRHPARDAEHAALSRAAARRQKRLVFLSHVKETSGRRQLVHA